MRKFVLILCLLVLAVNVHAERKFVLVELYHLTNSDFSLNNNEWVKNINKPHCKVGGTPEIDTGSLLIGFFDDTIGGLKGRLIDYPQYNYWQIAFPNSILTIPSTYNIRLTVKVYCITSSHALNNKELL